MNNLEPINQTKLYGLDYYFNKLVKLYKVGKYPNKILFSGQKGIGKSTLAFHFINYVLTMDQKYKYDIKKFCINTNSPEFKTVQNKSNSNFFHIDVNDEKKTIDINQIRKLIENLNKSSFNNKPRFVLIDNIELLNKNAINAMLKILEEPNENINFILIHNNKKILSTLLSRCINLKINLTHKDYLKISNQLVNKDLNQVISKDLINYYSSPGEIYSLVVFSQKNNLDLSNLDLKNFLRILIEEKYYKKNIFINNIIYNYIELYFRELNTSFSKLINEKYNYFVKRIADTKTYNLDKESLLIEFNEEILNG